MPSVTGSSVRKSVSNSKQLVPYENPFQHVNHQARFEDDPCGTSCHDGPAYVLPDKSTLAVHKMTGLQMLIVVLELAKYKSAYCCQIHEYTLIST